jgi:hypothetical protein
VLVLLHLLIFRAKIRTIANVKKTCMLYALSCTLFTGCLVPSISQNNEYNRLLSEAVILQLKADSLERILVEKRIIAQESPDEELKDQLMPEIIKDEEKALMFQQMADQKFAEAERIRTNPSSPDSVWVFARQISGIRIYRYNPETNPDVTAGKAAMKEKSDEFDILDKPAYDSLNPIPRDCAALAGLVYRVQIGVFSKKKPDDAFWGICPVCFEPAGENGTLRYYAGTFYSLKAANLALDRIRTYGFPDAFIVAFHDGASISTEKARELELKGSNL